MVAPPVTPTCGSSRMYLVYMAFAIQDVRPVKTLKSRVLCIVAVEEWQHVNAGLGFSRCPQLPLLATEPLHSTTQKADSSVIHRRLSSDGDA